MDFYSYFNFNFKTKMVFGPFTKNKTMSEQPSGNAIPIAAKNT